MISVLGFSIRHRAVILLALAWVAHGSWAQEERVVENGFNSWYATFVEAELSNELVAFGQYHFRRTDFGSAWQQSLLFLGAEWKSPSNLKWSAAYGNIVNFPGGQAAQEHRLFEQLIYTYTAGPWSLGHRHRVEHQWLEQKDFDPRHRYRIDFSASRPLGESGKWAFRAHNESLIALFDRTTNVVYQQNWLGVGFTWAASPSSKLCLEYLNQFVVAGDGWNATSNHTLNWLYIHKLNFHQSKDAASP